MMGVWAGLTSLAQLAPIATAIAAGFGVYVAWDGLHRWKREGLGKRRHELAEEVLAGFYELRTIIRFVRSPASFRGEGSGRQPVEGESAGEAQQRDTYYVPIARMMARNDFIASLMAKKFRMNALFGPSAEQPFDQIRDVLIEIEISAGALIQWYAGRPITEDGFRERQAIIWRLEGDELDKKVEAAVAAIEALCRPVLTDHSSFRR